MFNICTSLYVYLWKKYSLKALDIIYHYFLCLLIRVLVMMLSPCLNRRQKYYDEKFHSCSLMIGSLVSTDHIHYISAPRLRRCRPPSAPGWLPRLWWGCTETCSPLDRSSFHCRASFGISSYSSSRKCKYLAFDHRQSSRFLSHV